MWKLRSREISRDLKSTILRLGMLNRCLKFSTYRDYCDLEEALQFGHSQRLVNQNKVFVLMVLIYSEYLAANLRCSSFRVLNYDIQRNLPITEPQKTKHFSISGMFFLTSI